LICNGSDGKRMARTKWQLFAWLERNIGVKTPFKVRIVHYGLVPIHLVIAALLSELVHSSFPFFEPYIFLAAVVASAWIGGRWAGIIAAVLAPVVFDYFFLSPLYTLGISQEAWPYIASFWLSALAASWMSSARKTSREAKTGLQQAEEKFRRILTNLPEVAWTVDQTGRITYISPKVERIAGYSKHEICAGGLNLVLGRIHAEDLERVQRGLADLLSSGVPLDIEFRFQCKDGTWIWLHNRAPNVYEEGGLIHADGVISDVSRRKQAEIDLESKTVLLRAIVNASNIGILVVDANRNFVLQNQPMVEILRLPPELQGNPPTEAIRQHVVGLAKDPASFLAQAEYLHKHPEETGWDETEFIDGRIIDHFSGPIVDANGKYCGRIWTIRDITEGRRNELDLQAKTAFLEAQVNSTIDGILVVDASGHRLLVNQRLIEIFHIPPSLLVDTEDRHMLEYVLTLIKDAPSFLAKVEYLYSHPDEPSRDQIDLIDGTVLDRYSAPVIDNKGKHYGRIWNFRDVTELKKNEDILRQLSAAVEQSPASIVITDPLGNITYINRKFSECTGYSLEEARGKNPRILQSRFSSPEMYKSLWETVLSGKEWRGEFQNRKKNGEIFWESAAINPIVDQTGKIVHILAVTENITERRQMESDLRQAQKLEGIGQLAAGIAHEINTPTQFVTDNLTFLQESWETTFQLVELYRTAMREQTRLVSPTLVAQLAEAERKADLEFISEEVPRAIAQSLDGARRVANIVRAMKEFSHPDSADKTEADINKGVASTIAVARNEWKYVAEVITNFDDALPPVFCYPGEVNQVILNLIVNAAHSIKEKIIEGQKGEITVCTHLRGRFAEISITDTGMGIPEEIRNRVYEPFFTTKEVGKGTGQGLAFAHSVIVKKHQGKLWFETEPGRGTTFFLQVPIGTDQIAKETDAEAAVVRG
jgi:PAS domain S-box-containing protein